MTFYPNLKCCIYLHNPYKYFLTSLIAIKPSFQAVVVKLGSPFVGIDGENSQECLSHFHQHFFTQSITKVALHVHGYNFETSLYRLIKDIEFIKIYSCNFKKLESDLVSVWIKY